MLVRYHGWDRKAQKWKFLVIVDGWINHAAYKRELREWSSKYTCFAIEKI